MLGKILRYQGFRSKFVVLTQLHNQAAIFQQTIYASPEKSITLHFLENQTPDAIYITYSTKFKNVHCFPRMKNHSKGSIILNFTSFTKLENYFQLDFHEIIKNDDIAKPKFLESHPIARVMLASILVNWYAASNAQWHLNGNNYRQVRRFPSHSIKFPYQDFQKIKKIKVQEIFHTASNCQNPV